MIGAIAVGGALGALLRWGAGALNRPSWPIGTLLANLLATAFLAIATDRVTDAWLTVGVLGAASTWSSFVLETVEMIDHDEGGHAIGYVVVTIVGGVAVAWLATVAA